MRYYDEKKEGGGGGAHPHYLCTNSFSFSIHCTTDEHKLFYQSNLPIHTNDDHFLIH